MITAKSRRNRESDSPLLHAVPEGRWYGLWRKRSTTDAVCGAQVARMVNPSWDPQHPRACRKCKQWTTRR